MKKRNENLFWGIILILGALAVLAQRLGFIDFSAISDTVWTWIFAGVALLFLVLYLFSGLKEWGYLFPTCILGAISLIITLADRGSTGLFLGSIIFIGIAIPFLVAFLTNVRSNWWALIPTFALSVLAFIVNFSNSIRGEWIGALVLFSIGLPFLLVFFVNRTQRWALIPGLILVGLGVITLISMTSNLVAVLVPFVIAAPFFYVYFSQPKHWWAFIPAGIMTSIGVQSLLGQPFMGSLATSSIPAGVLFLGWSATFYFLYKRQATAPTSWARIPALVFVIVAIVTLVVGLINDEIGLIVVLFAAGVLLLYLGLRPKKVENKE